MKTDLNLLLECLKYQMDHPVSQKEALVTICSICQQNSEASDYFRQIGGLMFVNNLAKSSMECMVKEAALFTLGVLAESNVFCQQTLCTSELFEDIILSLSNEDLSMTLKRMSVYVILVMVSNNKTGQSLARETGCIKVLLQLFRTLSVSETNISDENINQCYQLWSSVCSALCACANNPQNDDNQKTCCSIFQYVKDWLQKCIMRPEFVRPICSLVGLTVANNAYAQDYFVSVGGLDTMAEILIKLVEDSHRSYSSAKLAVVVAKTLDACIADNSTASVVLSKYNTVSNLLVLLSSTSLSPGDRFSIVLTLGHCTEDCEENQCDLLKNSGLPLMIQVLTEFHDEEMNKAAIFVLQNCRQITEKLSLRLSEHSSNLTEDAALCELQIKERNLSDQWKKSKEILQRIEILEHQLNEDIGNSFQPVNTNPKQANFKSRETNHIPQHLEMDQTINTLNGKLYESAKTNGISVTFQDNLLMGCKGDASLSAAIQPNHKIPQHVNSADRNDELPKQLHPTAELETGHHCIKRRTVCGSVLQTSEQILKYPAPVRRNMKENVLIADPIMLCSDIIDKEIHNILETSTSGTVADSRCSGCIGLGTSLNSRNFSKILQSCAYQCDRHKVILEIEEKYKREIRKSLNIIDIQLTPIRKGGMNYEAVLKEANLQQNLQSIMLTPMKKVFASTPKLANSNKKYKTEKSICSRVHSKITKRTEWPPRVMVQDLAKMHNEAKALLLERLRERFKYLGFASYITADLQTEEIENAHDVKLRILNEKHVYSCNELKSYDETSSNVCIREFMKKKRRIRKEFTKEEINYLKDGVKKLGHHWNSILWSYPFQDGRTNVDLARKYQKLQQLQFSPYIEEMSNHNGSCHVHW
uniref:Telomere repeats-binding bouquet formation protein 1 n=1 Tax=Geotrypetes seraphini TaxID=260995 RepID=A0A6P8QDZ8_GEOSA|nr:telomere repeats-binding bouquet formation protein 1 [Geotrypetes seraphini]